MAFPECLKIFPAGTLLCVAKIKFDFESSKENPSFSAPPSTTLSFPSLFHRLAEIFHIADRCGSGCDRGLIHGIRIE